MNDSSSDKQISKEEYDRIQSNYQPKFLDLTPFTTPFNSNNQYFTMEVTPSSLNLKVGETKTIKVNIIPENSEVLKTINCSGIDYNLISFYPGNNPGEYIVKGLKAGTTGVNFVSSQYSNLNKTVRITVTEDTSDSENNGSGNLKPGRNEPNVLEVSPSVLNLIVGEKATLSFKVSSSGSDDIGTTNWNSENVSIASSSGFYSESSSGTITINAHSEGTTRIQIVNTKRSTENNEIIKTEKYITVNVKANTSSDNSSGSNNSGNNSNTNNSGSVNIYRLYNNKTGEHLYTSDSNEANTLSRQADWDHEGIGWKAPSSGSAVYRLYSPVTGVHLFTTDRNEVNVLLGSGWSVDNGGNPLFYSGGTKNVYRLYSPALRMHLITTDLNEYNVLAGQGWNQEGVKLNAQ